MYVTFFLFSTLFLLLSIWRIFLNRRNSVIILMSIEIMLLAVNTQFLVFSVFHDDLSGQLFAYMVLTIAAEESAIGLALLVMYYRVRQTIDVILIYLLKGFIAGLEKLQDMNILKN